MVQAISRATEIIRQVAGSERGLRLFELTELMNLKRSTAHNLAASLIRDGWLKKDAASRYQLGDLIGDLYLKQQRNVLFDTVKKEMLRLSGLVNGTALTYARFGRNEIIETFRITPDQPRRIFAPEGSVLNPYFTVSGILHFALLPDADLDLLKMRYPFIPVGLELWKEESRWLDAITVCRERGYARIPFDRAGDCRVGMPVFDSGNFAGTLTWSKHGFTEIEKKMMLQEAKNGLFKTV